MQKRDRKRYSREFKDEVVRRTQITGKSMAEVARELELPVHHLYKWRAELDRKKVALAVSRLPVGEGGVEKSASKLQRFRV